MTTDWLEWLDFAGQHYSWMLSLAVITIIIAIYCAGVLLPIQKEDDTNAP